MISVEVKKNVTKECHIDPAFMLGKFCTPETAHIRSSRKRSVQRYIICEQKWNDKPRKAEAISRRRNFYNSKIGNNIFSLEPSLAKIENNFANILTAIEKSSDPMKIIQENKGLLLFFISLQMARQPNYRKLYEACLKEMNINTMPVHIFSGSNQETLNIPCSADNFHNSTLFYTICNIMKCLINHRICLYRTTEENIFYTVNGLLASYLKRLPKKNGNLVEFIECVATKSIHYFPINKRMCIVLSPCGPDNTTNDIGSDKVEDILSILMSGADEMYGPKIIEQSKMERLLAKANYILKNKGSIVFKTSHPFGDQIELR